jgi:hypothetical protein
LSYLIYLYCLYFFYLKTITKHYCWLNSIMIFNHRTSIFQSVLFKRRNDLKTLFNSEEMSKIFSNMHVWKTWWRDKWLKTWFFFFVQTDMWVGSRLFVQWKKAIGPTGHPQGESGPTYTCRLSESSSQHRLEIICGCYFSRFTPQILTIFWLLPSVICLSHSLQLRNNNWIFDNK